MTLTRKPKRTWLCPRCGHRNEVRTSSRKCQNEACGEQSKPAKRLAKHKTVLREIGYEEWALISLVIHGGELYACGVCGKPPSENRKQDRDHNHKTGKVRGLACPGNMGCNYLMLPWITAATAEGIARAKFEANEPDAERWSLIAAYLERVEAHYRGT